MTRTLVALTALAAFTIPSFAFTSESNRCHDPRQSVNYQGECVDTFKTTDQSNIPQQDEGKFLRSLDLGKAARSSHSPLDDLEGDTSDLKQ